MDIEVPMITNYLSTLIGRVYKILPLWEEQADTVGVYIHSLQLELMGLQNLSTPLGTDAVLLSVISTLQYLIDHPETEREVVKREVFRSIRSCDMLRCRYADGDDA